MTPRIDRERLIGRLDTFNRIGALAGGGNCRLALSDEDRAGRFAAGADAPARREGRKGERCLKHEAVALRPRLRRYRARNGKLMLAVSLTGFDPQSGRRNGRPRSVRERSRVMRSSQTMGEARADDRQSGNFPSRNRGFGRSSAILCSRGAPATFPPCHMRLMRGCLHPTGPTREPQFNRFTKPIFRGTP